MRWLAELDQRVFGRADAPAAGGSGAYSPYAGLLALATKAFAGAAVLSTVLEVVVHRRPVATGAFVLVGLLIGALAGHTIGERIATLAAYARPVPARAAIEPSALTPVAAGTGLATLALLLGLPPLAHFPTIVPGVLAAAAAQFALQRTAVGRAERALDATLLAPAKALLVAEDTFRVTRSSAAPPP